MPKLTDTQLVILKAAVSRENQAVLPLPKSLKVNKGTAASVLKMLLTKRLIEERPTASRAEAWRQDDAGLRYALTITDAGLAALEGGLTAATEKCSGTRTPRSRQPKEPVLGSKPGANSPVGKRPGGKLENILTLLKRPKGAPLVELEKATGWQPHSVRAALTGLRKRDIAILREKQDGVTRYRIAAA